MVHQLLQSLGGSADEVAEALRAKKIHGVPNSARYLNPVVRFVQLHVTAQTLDMMQGDRLRIEFADGTKEEVILPPAVLDFLAAFNQGKYPDLEMSVP